MMDGKILIAQDGSQQYRWGAVKHSGEVIAASHRGWPTKREAILNMFEAKQALNVWISE